MHLYGGEKCVFVLLMNNMERTKKHDSGYIPSSCIYACRSPHDLHPLSLAHVSLRWGSFWTVPRLRLIWACVKASMKLLSSANSHMVSLKLPQKLVCKKYSNVRYTCINVILQIKTCCPWNDLLMTFCPFRCNISGVMENMEDLNTKCSQILIQNINISSS